MDWLIGWVEMWLLLGRCFVFQKISLAMLLIYCKCDLSGENEDGDASPEYAAVSFV